jgi:hypothetical protein
MKAPHCKLRLKEKETVMKGLQVNTHFKVVVGFMVSVKDFLQKVFHLKKTHGSVQLTDSKHKRRRTAPLTRQV